MRPLYRPRPHRHRAKTIESSFPTKRLRFGECLRNQHTSFLRPATRFVWIGAVGKKLVGSTTEKQHDKPSATQLIEHRQFFSNPHWIVHRHQRPKHGNLCPT